MSSSKYQAFVTVAQLGGITKAADHLGYTQSGVSHLIATLEADLGIELLIRSKSGTVLTTQGKELLPYFNRVLTVEQELRDKVRDLHGLSAGQLRIGTFSSVAIHWIPDLMALFRERYPSVEASVFNGNYAQVEEALLQGNVDCAFVSMPSRREFLVQELTRDRLLVVMSERNPLADQEVLRPRDLREETFIGPAEGSRYNIGKILSRAGAVPESRLDINDDYAAVELVRRGLGVTILPELLLRSLPKEGLALIPLKGEERVIGLAVRRDRHQTPAIRAFLTCADDIFTQASRSGMKPSAWFEEMRRNDE